MGFDRERKTRKQINREFEKKRDNHRSRKNFQEEETSKQDFKNWKYKIEDEEYND